MNKLSTFALIAASTLLAFDAYALPLAPNSVVFPTGITISNTPLDPVERPYIGGPILNENIIDFTYNPTPASPLSVVGGQVQNRVLENSAGNMIFMQRLREIFNRDGGTFAILAYSLDGYAGFDVDVDFRLDGFGDDGFTSVSRSVDGDVLTFRYDDPIIADSLNPPGLREESLFPAIVTDATQFDTSGTMTVFGEIIPLGERTPSGNANNLFTVQVDGIAAPRSQAVPEPSTLVVWSLLGVVGFFAKKRRRSS